VADVSGATLRSKFDNTRRCASLPLPLNSPKVELTKEHFDQVISGLATKEGLAQQTEELKAYAREQTEELAGMVSQGFEDVHRRLDVIAQVKDIQQTMDRKFAKLEEALHIKL
jgi:hypothetical protein